MTKVTMPMQSWEAKFAEIERLLRVRIAELEAKVSHQHESSVRYYESNKKDREALNDMQREKHNWREKAEALEARLKLADELLAAVEQVHGMDSCTCRMCSAANVYRASKTGGA